MSFSNEENLDNGRHREGEDYTHEDFHTMSLRDVEKISGVIRPMDRTAEAHAEYRERAWRSYQQDIQNRDEWGTARQGIDEDPEVTHE